MALFDQGSMTPPLSPMLIEMDDDGQPSPSKQQQGEGCDTGAVTGVSFSCTRGNSGHFSRLHRILNLDKTSRAENLPPLVELFTYNFTGQYALQTDMESLFPLLRQSIGEAQAGSKQAWHFISGNNEAVRDAGEIRQQIVEFLHYVQDYLLQIRDPKEVSDTFLQRLIWQLHSTLLYSGRLPHGNQSSSVNFHLHLDLYWTVLEIIHILDDSFSDVPGFVYRRLFLTADQETGLFSEMVKLILWDLVGLANDVLTDKGTGRDYTRVTMFPCACVRDLWRLVLQLLEWGSKQRNGDSFWVSLHQVLLEVISPDTAAMDTDIDCDVLTKPEMVVKDRFSLCLWIIHQVAPLFTESMLPSNKVQSNRPSNYHDLQMLMKKYIADENVSEGMFRQHLKCCCILSELWEPNTSLLTLLWDYFYRKLNNTFQLNTTTVEGLAVMKMEKETSFQLFQRLLCIHLCRLQQSGVHHEWKQIKGRFYSKFHQRRMQELTEGGLYNFTSLFVTLAVAADTMDVAAKLCDFYDMLDYSRMTAGRRMVVWRGAFTLILIHQEKGLTVDLLADRLVTAFNSTVMDLREGGTDIKHSLWKLIQVYLEGVQDVFDASQKLDLSEGKLLCSGFKPLLSVCGENELRSALTVLQAVVSRFRQVCQNCHTGSGGQHTGIAAQHNGIADALWINIYPFIKDHCATLTPPPQLADFAATLCLVSLTYPPGKTLGNREDFISVFQLFALGENTNISVSCRFLSHVLPDSDVMDSLKLSLPDQYQTLLIQTWLRCLLVSGPSQLQEITRCVLDLEDVKTTFNSAQMDVPEDMAMAAMHYLKAMERTYKAQSWKEKVALKDRVTTYCSDIMKHIGPTLRNLGPSAALATVYKMTGCLMKYWAPMLFVQTTPNCLLPVIINRMILPHKVYNTSRPLDPRFLEVIRDTLHLYVQGLSKLDYQTAPYVARILKDIVTVYLPKFSLSTQTWALSSSLATTVHPLVTSLCGSYGSQPSNEAKHFRQYMMTIVGTYYLTRKSSNFSSSHLLGLSFITEVRKRTTSQEVLARDCIKLLPCVQECLLLTEPNGQSHETAMSLLQDLIEAYVLNNTVTPLSDIRVKLEGTIRGLENRKGATVSRQKIQNLLQLLGCSEEDTKP